MPRYQYHAVDAQGKAIQGAHEDACLADLDAWLTQNGLMLLSFSEEGLPAAGTSSQGKNLSRTSSPAGTITDESKLSPLARKYGRIMVYFKTGQGMSLLIGSLVLISMADFIYFTRYAQTNPYWHKAETNPLADKISSIRIGIARSDVEKLFPVALPDPDSPDNTIYIVNQNIALVIHYDAMGGAGNPANRVMQRPLFKALSPR